MRKNWEIRVTDIFGRVDVMSRKELLRRYLLFLGAVFVNAFSIAVITRALLGTSPISSVPYVLSLCVPSGTLGSYTIIMNLLFIVLEMCMMKRHEIREKRYELLLQVPITLCFGFFIDEYFVVAATCTLSDSNVDPAGGLCFAGRRNQF